jgi:threonine aldolase
VSPFEIDLRSDTVTEPTEAMRDAMRDAVVGDGGSGEDPTVTLLEQRFAQRVGKEAAMFVPSGVMANQIAVRVLAQPGDLIVCGARQHVVLYELGASAKNSGVQFHPVDDSSGVLEPESISTAIEGAMHHHPSVAAVFVENTHMPSGGRYWTDHQMHDVAEAAAQRPIHLDGARLFNAEVASGIPADQLAAEATTVMCCLSKGLSAPVGSLLAGPREVIDQALVERKRLGGTMRQAGVIAAPGLVALETMVDRLAEDHARAHELARAVAARWPQTESTVMTQPTNIVVFIHDDTAALLDHLKTWGIGADTIAPKTIRLVTHRGIDDRAVARAVEAIESAP